MVVIGWSITVVIGFFWQIVKFMLNINRVVIETLHNEGRSLRYIANYLGFSKTTIFNELHRLNSEY